MSHRPNREVSRLTRRQAVCRLTEACGVAVLPLPAAAFMQASGSAARMADDDDAVSGQNGDRLIHVRYRDAAGDELLVKGRVLVRAADGGLLVEDRAGRLRTVTPDRLVSEQATEQSWRPLTGNELGDVLVAEARAAGIDAEFQIHSTRGYVIATSTPLAYAEWTGRLLERLQLAFRSYWKNRHFELQEAAGPLPVLILSDQAQFARLAEFDRTPGSAQGQGYYLVTANRVVLYDLTARDGAALARTIADVQRRVQQNPASVATVVHEATHQIAFNRGMHRRYADNPVWLTEGMAMYFETPDLRSRRGWSTIGRVNRVRLTQFRKFVQGKRQPDSLETLIRDNSRFADPDLAMDAYAEAWALTHFLIQTRTRDYATYLKQVSQKRPLVWDSADERLDEFRAAFGVDLAKLNRELISYAQRLR